MFGLRLIEKLLIIYYLSYFLIDIILYFIFVFNIRFRKKNVKPAFSHHDFSVTVVVPAYNEEVSIIDCLEMLGEIEYGDFEIIVVNDGSKDQTMEKLLKHYAPEVHEKLPANEGLTVKPIRKVWSDSERNIIFIDKENGGKADAINAAINYSTRKYICTLDADSILDKNALLRVMEQFAADPSTFVAGGMLAVANEVVIRNNQVTSLRMPRNIWVLWQIVEYIKSFLISRVGLGKLNSILVMSGAFSVFRRDDLVSAGGYLTAINHSPYILQTVGRHRQTLCEDMEIVLRLWRYHHEHKHKVRAVFLPLPVCWTEVPDNSRNLFRQRVRWHTGLAESLSFHLKMMFDPAYKVTGLFAMPYYFFFELFSPLVKVLTIAFLIIASLTQLINISWVVMMIIGTTLITAIITSSMTVLTEYWSYRQSSANRSALRYHGTWEWILLILAGLVSDFSYSFYRSYAQLKGLWDFLLKKNNWNKFERKGIKRV